MLKRIRAHVLGGLLCCAASPVSAQQLFAEPAPPGPAARELAEILVPSEGPLTAQTLAALTEQHLLSVQAAWRGPACDPDIEACVAAAREVAAQFVPRQQQAARARLVQLYGARLQTAMNEAEMQAAIAYLRSPAGAPLATGLNAFLSDDQFMLQTRLLVAAALAESNKDSIDAFYDRTSDLPRRKQALVVAPPPPPPAPPRRPAR